MRRANLGKEDMLETGDRPLLGTAAGKEVSEGSSYFDDLATALADGSISRRQALKGIGAGALAFVIGPLFPEQAEALTRAQRRRCRRRGGQPVESGECHCAYLCQEPEVMGCEGNPECTCFKTVGNRGFCGRHGQCQPCTASSECPPGWRCVVNTCCTDDFGNPVPTCLPPCEAEDDPNLAADPNAPTSNGR
jgi:hypothetical protein